MDTSAILNEAMSTLSSLNLDEMMRNFAYQGFDPAVIVQTVYKIAQDKGRTFSKDVQSMIVLVLTRGTQVSKMSNKTSAVGVNEIRVLQNIYGLKGAGLGGSGSLAAKDLTLSRVANAFSLIACKIAHTKNVRIVGDTVTGLPKGYHWPGGASMIPKGAKEMYKLWVVYAYSFDLIVNPKTISEDERMKKVDRYGQIMLNNTFYKEDLRADLLTVLSRDPEGVNHPSDIKATIKA